MSLQAKFAWLLGTIGLTVVLTLAASVWAMNFMHEEVRRPFQIMSSSLTQLQLVMQGLESQREAVLGKGADGSESAPSTRAECGDAFQANTSAILDAMDTLNRNESVFTETGHGSLSNLQTRLADAQQLSKQWFASGDSQDQAAAVESLRVALLLARRLETRFISETHNLLVYAVDLRRHVTALVVFVLIVTVLTCTLGLLLVRRWVVLPVAELRTATSRIAAGDFLHRIPVRGGDELGALSIEVNTMAAMVKTMQDEAVQRERLAAVGEVVQRIAHNLRSPLAGIRGLAELTRKELDSPGVSTDLRSDLGENQQRIIGAVDRFELWLRDLLSATRPLEIVHRTLGPREWLERLVEAYRPKAQANRITLELETDEAPKAAAFDPRHLEHAIGAIIANAMDAVAASPPQDQAATVRVRCRMLPRESGENGQLWELQVRDNGPGVPPDLRDRIFAPYFSTKREGTGIGLALARQVIQAHGGSLSLLDEPHDGGAMGGNAPRDRGAVFSALMPIGPIEIASPGVAKTGHSELLSGQSSCHRG